MKKKGIQKRAFNLGTHCPHSLWGKGLRVGAKTQKALLSLILICSLWLIPVALHAQSKTKKQAPKNPSVISLYQKASKLLRKDDKPDSALKVLNQVLALDSNYKDALRDRANIYFDARKFDLSLKDFIHLGYIPKAMTAFDYGRRGIIYSTSNNSIAAIQDFKSAIALSPRDSDYYVLAGSEYLKTEQYKNALEYLQKAVDMHYHSADAYSRLGFAYTRAGDNRKAALYLSEAIKMNPKDSINYFYRGFAYIEINQNELAEEDLLYYLKGHPEDLITLYNLGRAQYAAKEYKNAVTTWNRIIDLNYNYTDTWFRLGLTYGELNDYNNAVSAFTIAIKNAAKEEGYLYYNRAVAKLRLSKDSDYCSDLHIADQLGYTPARKMFGELCK